MSLQVNPTTDQERLFNSIRKIKSALRMDNTTFLNSLGVTKKEYSCVVQGRSHLLISQIESFCSYLGLNIENLLLEKYDLRVLQCHYQGDPLTVSERYENSEEKMGRIRAIKSLYRYLEFHFGLNFADNILSRLQIHPLFLEQPDTTFVSWHIFFDILRELSFKGLEGSHFFGAGIVNLTLNRYSDLGKVLSQQKTPKDLYRSLHDVVGSYYDNLFVYRLIKLTDEYCRIETTYNRDALDTSRTLGLGGRESCIYKQGVYSSFLGLMRNRLAKVEEKECLYFGDSRCVYHLTWEQKPSNYLIAVN